MDTVANFTLLDLEANAGAGARVALKCYKSEF